jgi:UDP-3-O-[3-hydroxymyristoyl] N-acetylglucosamine deacetylase
MQKTLKTSASFSGVGLHSGAKVMMTLFPEATDRGVRFIRTDLLEEKSIEEASLPARWDLVEESELCTRLTNSHGVSISTIEHIMSALAGLGIDNARIEVNGPEVPIMDGSALEFVGGLMKAGIVMQHKPRRALKILQAVEIEEEGKKAAFVPSHMPIYTFSIDFPGTVIGRQDLTFEHLSDDSYASLIADCRTFTNMKEVEFLRSKGLIKGGSLDNAIVVEGQKVINGPLRHKDEFVRHKILDAIGDVALSGHMVIGHFIANKGGHALTNKLLRKLFDTPKAYKLEDCYNDFEGLQGQIEESCFHEPQL